jgi:drug/metabolite transporter (DMT)-like permease
VSRRGWLLFAAMSVLWGIPYLLIKVALRELDPVALVFSRTAIAALVLVPLATGRRELIPALRRWPTVLMYAVIEVAIPWWLLSDAEEHISSSLAGLLVAAVPLVGALLARVTGERERIDRGRLAGLLVGFAGVVALLGLDVSGSPRQLRGALETLAVAVCYAIGPLIVQRRLAGVPAVGVNATALGVTALAYAPLAALRLPPHVPSAEVGGAVLTLGLLCTALGFVLFFALITEVGAARSTVITYVNPAVAILLGVGILGESFTVGTAIGFPLVLIGSYFGARTRRTAESERRTEVPAAAGQAL